MINPEALKRLQILSKDVYGSNFDVNPFLFNQSEGAMHGLPKKRLNSDYLNLIFALIKNECEFSSKFWFTYGRATIASRKLNSTLSLDNICKLVEITKKNFKETKSKEDEDLLLELLEFISTNSLLSGANDYITSSVDYPLIAQQKIPQSYFERITLEGRTLLLDSVALLYGITVGHPPDGEEINFPTKKQLEKLQKFDLIEKVDEPTLHSLPIDSDDNISKEEFYSIKLDGLLHGAEIMSCERKLRIFKNRMAYVRVDRSGEYLPKFSDLWEMATVKKNKIFNIITKKPQALSGEEAYEAIIDSIEHLQECLSARQNLFLGSNNDLTIDELKLISGLDNSKSIKNEINQPSSVLEPIENRPSEVTKASAFKWLNDSKRRKARFFNILENFTELDLNKLKEFYLTELNS
tara:strand:+ start:803 stop:2029 length:1227 start_codon:yes stop_codon:yes gene_type:complete